MFKVMIHGAILTGHNLCVILYLFLAVNTFENMHCVYTCIIMTAIVIKTGKSEFASQILIVNEFHKFYSFELNANGYALLISLLSVISFD